MKHNLSLAQPYSKIKDPTPFIRAAGQDAPSLRERFVTAFQARGLKPTPQALCAIIESIDRSPSELIGDTDSLLVGLLYSGSYTVDILETAGVPLFVLRKLADDSVSVFRWGDQSVDPVDTFFNAFGSRLGPIVSGNSLLETSHLLAAAISPYDESNLAEIGGLRTDATFPFHLRADGKPSGRLQTSLDQSVADLLTYLCTYLDINNVPQLLNARRTAITSEEDYRLDKQLGVDHRDMEVDELEFAIAALNEWFRHRRLLTDPPDLCLRTVSRCRPLLYGPMVFAEAGGNLKSVDIGLDLSRRYSPERDLPAISLFCDAGRIHVGEYTYRNTLWVPSGQRSSSPFQRVAVDALRPVPLIPTTVIQELESLVNRGDLRELDIQEFLNKHPEILLSLGYAQAHPHLALREQGKTNMIPDYFLEIPGQRRSDILDLKLPTVRLTVRNPYLNLSAQLNKAIGQLRAYELYFEKSKNRRAFTNAYGLDAFKPGLIVVIGRRAELSQLESRVEIEARLAGVRLLTYDDLIDYGRSRSLLVPSVRH